MTCKQAVILVGGRGTRLGTLALDTPKPLMPITEDTCFLDYVLFQVSRHGFTNIVLLAGHLGSRIVERYHDRVVGGGQITVFVERAACGTGGALVEAAHILDDRFLLMNGDSLFNVDLRSFADGAATQPAQFCLLLREVPDVGRYGSVSLAGNRVTRFREKDPIVTGPGLISVGIYSMSKSICDEIDTLPCSIETNVFPRLAASNNLGGIIADGYFVDIGLPDTLEQARTDLPLLYPSFDT